MISRSVFLPNETSTAQLASRIAPLLCIGDCLLLEGQIGAGKTCFARALIRARLNRLEDVPSPTFTLVQTYDDPHGDIWHCDLYRLTHPDEAIELGILDALETSICLIEWPDRLGRDQPRTAMHLLFTAGPNGHHVTASVRAQLATAFDDA